MLRNGGIKTLLYAGTTEYPHLPKCENDGVRSISREGDLGWLAGILDGEGALGADTTTRRHNTEYLDVKIRVCNTDVRMIEKISRIYVDLGIVFFYCFRSFKNRNNHPKKGWRDVLEITVSAQNSCLRLIEEVGPYLVNKRDHAYAIADIIRYVKNSPRKGNAHPKKLTIEQVDAIRRDTRTSRQIAPEYGIAAGTVSLIKRDLQYMKRSPRNNYANDPKFMELMARWKLLKETYIEPSTTIRRAGEILMIESELMGDHERIQK